MPVIISVIFADFNFLFPAIDCDFEKNPDLSQAEEIEIEFENTSLSCAATLHNSTLWNMDSERGYWYYSNDIKACLTINSQGNLKVSVCSFAVPNTNMFYKTRNTTQCRQHVSQSKEK